MTSPPRRLILPLIGFTLLFAAIGVAAFAPTAALIKAGLKELA